jgi:hypothetical protein
MYDLTAYAVRKNGVIQVALSGFLANSCYSASVKDKYPGGNIFYIVDPGTAQIFIDETMKLGSDICLMMLVPWVSHVSIPDTIHSQVNIFINGDSVLTVDVKVDFKEVLEQYRVIALTAPPDGGTVGCSVIPADAPYLAIYSSVYGPASKAECENWRQGNCTAR